MKTAGTCPLTTKQIVDEYFIENRTRVLEIAAFLDRLGRSSDQAAASEDFRVEAFRRALRLLASDEPSKIDQVQMLLSDPTSDPKSKLDTKSASGAWSGIVSQGVR